jgi:hypothetical protein
MKENTEEALRKFIGELVGIEAKPEDVEKINSVIDLLENLIERGKINGSADDVR